MDLFMIKPYTILSTRSEGEYGTGVDFSVSTRFVVNEPGFKGERTVTHTSAVLVPPNEDIDEYLLKYLIDSNWITQ